MAQELAEKILQQLVKESTVDTLDLAKLFNEDHQKIIGALKSIQANGDLVAADAITHKRWELSEEGRLVVEKGQFINPYLPNKSLILAT